jgi:hypothetical protein
MRKVAGPWWLTAGLGTTLLVGFAAPILQVRLGGDDLRVDGDDLRVSVPAKFQFLSGKPLEKLKDGATLEYLAQLSLSASSEVSTPLVRPAVNRFVVSYDVWEEKFSVTSTVLERATASHLSAAAAEAWCLDHLPLGIDGVPRDKPLWIKLELRAEDARDQTGIFGSSSINLTRLIEVFSNPARAQQMHWEASAGPVRLEDLKRERRSSRSG